MIDPRSLHEWTPRAGNTWLCPKCGQVRAGDKPPPPDWTVGMSGVEKMLNCLDYAELIVPFEVHES